VGVGRVRKLVGRGALGGAICRARPAARPNYKTRPVRGRSTAAEIQHHDPGKAGPSHQFPCQPRCVGGGGGAGRGGGNRLEHEAGGGDRRRAGFVRSVFYVKACGRVGRARIGTNEVPIRLMLQRRGT
jgi:hypothetical protein